MYRIGKKMLIVDSKTKRSSEKNYGKKSAVNKNLFRVVLRKIWNASISTTNQPPALPKKK